MALTAVGMVLAVVGALRNDRWMVWGAIGCIGASILLRILGRRI
jgi:hypothetical protein